MPSLVRRLLIWAAVDGLILQGNGPAEHQKTLKIDYSTRSIKEVEVSETSLKKATPLESHGIVGKPPVLSSELGRRRLTQNRAPLDRIIVLSYCYNKTGTSCPDLRKAGLCDQRCCHSSGVLSYRGRSCYYDASGFANVRHL